MNMSRANRSRMCMKHCLRVASMPTVNRYLPMCDNSFGMLYYRRPSLDMLNCMTSMLDMLCLTHSNLQMPLQTQPVWYSLLVYMLYRLRRYNHDNYMFRANRCHMLPMHSPMGCCMPTVNRSWSMCDNSFGMLYYRRLNTDMLNCMTSMLDMLCQTHIDLHWR